MSPAIQYPHSIQEYYNNDTNQTYTFTQFVTPLAERERHERRRPKYTRSKTGCLTCRRKKIKCDERKPVCQRCTHSQLDCMWPPAAPPSKKARRKVSIAPKIDGESSGGASSSLQVPQNTQAYGQTYARGRSEPRAQMPSDLDPLQTGIRHHSVPEASNVDGSYTYHAVNDRSLGNDIMTYTNPHYSFPEPSLRIAGSSTQTSRPSTANSQSSPYIGYQSDLAQLNTAPAYPDNHNLQAHPSTSQFSQYTSQSRPSTAGSIPNAQYLYQNSNGATWQPQPVYPTQSFSEGYASQTFTYNAPP